MNWREMQMVQIYMENMEYEELQQNLFLFRNNGG
jgi:hypothetical protein